MQPELHDPLGHLLLERGIISEPQLKEALAFKARKPFLRLGEILLGWDVITLDQLVMALESQGASLRLGQILMRNGHLRPDDLARALERQARSSELLGAVLVDMGLVSAERIQEALDYQGWFEAYVAHGANVLRNNPSLASVHNPVIHPRWAAIEQP
jgi:type IV pilus assembly protein PilB